MSVSPTFTLFLIIIDCLAAKCSNGVSGSLITLFSWKVFRAFWLKTQRSLQMNLKTIKKGDSLQIKSGVEPAKQNNERKDAETGDHVLSIKTRIHFQFVK